MLKKLDEKKILDILETGISEFSQQGLEKTNINIVAKKAGVSVGVLYKYFVSKDEFFMACLKHSLSVLKKVIDEALQGEQKILVRAEKLIRAVQKNTREHENYNAMYHEITSGGFKKYAVVLAEEIESISAKVYPDFLRQAQMTGEIRTDADPKMFAFFFDSLLITLQFSYSCDYYRERFKLYCGEDILDDDEKVVKELLKFLESAFTTSQSEIKHS
ncbi:MAG TPA: TetR/AcrR family transcriptional regulator [Clostridia bacterium]|nr:TetR/AcrR family transcriptional regulator [Clostridia bacterium]